MHRVILPNLNTTKLKGNPKFKIQNLVVLVKITINGFGD